jgi:hypothetical protein
MTRRDDNRAAFPGTAEAIDNLRAVFGPGVKLLHATENGRSIGKPQPFDGTDIDQFIRLDDAMKQRGTA